MRPKPCGKSGETPKLLCDTQKSCAGKPELSSGKTSGKPQAGSTSWSGRTVRITYGVVIFAQDLEPIHTRLEPSPDGPRLHLESETFAAILPATPHILSLLAAKLARTVTA